MGRALRRGPPFFYGWIILASAGSAQVVRNAAASLTIAVFMFPLSEELGWSRTLIAGAASFGGLAASALSPAVGWLVDKYGRPAGAVRQYPHYGAVHYIPGLGYRSRRFLYCLRRWARHLFQPGANRLIRGRIPLVHSDARARQRYLVRLPLRPDWCCSP